MLAVDVGATTIKMGHFSAVGVALAARTRRTTPHPCDPTRLVELIAQRAAHLEVERIGVGFPGEVDHGVVIDGANLTRSLGPMSPVDDELVKQWSGFALESELHRVSGLTVRVLNDAATAALGCARGVGVELVVTLGTGCGLALVRDGELVRVRDVGADTLVGSATYDDLLGERGRRRDEEKWIEHVVSAVTQLAHEFSATTIHLAGGNARRLSPYAFGEWGESLVIERNDPALIGAWRACYP